MKLQDQQQAALEEAVAIVVVAVVKVKGNGFLYSLPSVGRGADPNVRAVNLLVT